MREAAAVVLAGSGAPAGTVLDGLDHLDRGYEGITGTLVACGAEITRSVK
jgi:UDP-N-acetylglucosamine 1-carboxyvinyltransferase